jgi:UDPglucose 6-dehydrogenase
VERAMRGDPRIGPRAYLRAGSGFAGGTLARDLAFLSEIGRERHVPTPLFDGTRISNHLHLRWAEHALLSTVEPLRGQSIAVLGLTYKPGTNTLRRSSAVETCRWLSANGARVAAFDPALTDLPDELRTFIDLRVTAEDALRGSSAALVATEWPEFAAITSDDFVGWMKTPVVVDVGRFLEAGLGTDARLRYVAVGRGR